jgi:hypothetical protein
MNKVLLRVSSFPILLWKYMVRSHFRGSELFLSEQKPFLVRLKVSWLDEIVMRVKTSSMRHRAECV